MRLSLVAFSLCFAGIAAWAAPVGVQMDSVSGRVDYQASSMTTFEPIKAAQLLPSNGILQLQNLARARVRVDSQVFLDFKGPAKARLLKSLVATGEKSETVGSEIEGTVRVTAGPGSLVRLSCGAVQLRNLQGVGNLVCMPDSQVSIVWMEQGRVELIRGDAHTIVLEPGRVWRLQKSTQGYVESWLDPKQAGSSQGHKAILLNWNKLSTQVAGTRWNMGSALQSMLLAMPGLVAQGDSLEWQLSGQVERFDVLDSVNTWTVRLVVQFELKNVWYPFQVRELRFDQQLVLENNEQNRLKLLKLLPLDLKNSKMKQSGIGRLMTALQMFIEKEALDPFRRGGFKIDPLQK